MPSQSNDIKINPDGTLRSWVLAHPRLAMLIGSILLFMFLSLLVIAVSDHARLQYWSMQVDVFSWLNNAFSSMPMFWLNMSYLCDALVLLPILSFLIIVKPRVYAAMFGSIPLAVLLVHGGKNIANVPRPAAVLDSTSMVIHGQMLIGHNSLPSGHTATVFVAACVLGISMLSISSRCWRLFCILFVVFGATLLSFSRVAVGAHWPVDLVYGAMCGCLGAVSGFALTYRYIGWWKWMKNSSHLPVVGSVLVVWGVALHTLLGVQFKEDIWIIYLASLVGFVVGLYLILCPFFQASLCYRTFSMRVSIKYPSVDFNWSK